jgi:heparinase II/III-like protein
MKAISLQRVLRMSRAEISWRTRQVSRTTTQRLAARLGRPRWQRVPVHRLLAEGALDRTFRVDRERAPWRVVHVELARAIQRRGSRFALDPSSRPDIRDAVLTSWPGAAAEAAARADNILEHRYDVLGYRGLAWGSNGTVPDWHLDPVHQRRAPLQFWADVPYLDSAIGDHKIIWELNRHQHWLQLGRALWLTDDRRYRQGLIVELDSWLAANPPLLGINWASMLEIGFRAISWMWALHFLLADVDGDPEASWLVDVLVALDRQLTHVEQNLSRYFSPNTHLTGEALALYVVGVALPELAAGPRWAEIGRTILVEEIGRQIQADGGHAERSTHYQRYTLDFYLMALLTAERDGDSEAMSTFAEAAGRLADFTRAMADDEGRLPLIGDDDGGMLAPIAGRACTDVRDSLALAAILLDRPDLAPWGLQEEAIWMAGRRAIAAAPRLAPSAAVSIPSRTLEETGFVVARDGSGSHATFDVGPHGYLNAGHAHADALSITLGVEGRPLLIDPGTSTYTMNPDLRDRLRSSMSHNTVTIDDRSQATPSGPFHWRTRADARLHGSVHNPGFDWAEAFHDAYAPLRHRRTLLRTAHDGWLIVDEMLGQGVVTASAHWHFDPEWTLQSDAPFGLRARHPAGIDARLLHDAADMLLAHGDGESGLGWYGPVYGVLTPIWSACTKRRAAAPFALVTWIGTQRADAIAEPRLERVTTSSDSGTSIGVGIVDGHGRAVFLLRPGEPATRDSRACGIRDYQTNARVLHYAERDGRLITLDLVDASHALALRNGWVSVSASDALRDLHITLADGALHVYTSAPPPQLQLQGDAIRGVRQLYLNRRDGPLPLATRTDTLCVSGADWCGHHPRMERDAASAIYS